MNAAILRFVALRGLERPGGTMGEKKEITRREFVKDAAAAGAAFTIVPRHVLGRGMTPPSELLNIAAVGVGGMGRTNLLNLASQNIVAMCDVDWGYANKGFDQMDTEIHRLQARLDRPGFAPVENERPEFDPVRAKARIDSMIKLKTEHLPKAKRYKDYREMLERQKDIEAVLVATADH